MSKTIMDATVKANIVSHMLENGRYRCKTRKDVEIQCFK
jgi:hypothetical protein